MALQKESRLLRIGVLGCGPIAQIAHFDACRKARNVDLYAVCDVSDEIRIKMTARWEPKRSYDSFERLLSDENVEAVIIAVADDFHAPLAQQALAAGKHVLVEKPLAVSVEECYGLQHSVESSQCTLQVGNNRRFDPAVVFARDFVAHELGSPLTFKAWYHDSKFRYEMTDNLQPIIQSSSSVRRPSTNPKADLAKYYLLTHGSHLVDTARCLGGQILSVRARRQVQKSSHCWFVEVAFTNGSLGHLDLIVPAQADFEEGFSIFGDSGSLEGRLFLPWYHKAGRVECFSTRDRVYRRPLGSDAYTYKLQLESFADTILHGAPQLGADVHDGLAAVQTLVAVARSVESGEQVVIADAKGGV